MRQRNKEISVPIHPSITHARVQYRIKKIIYLIKNESKFTIMQYTVVSYVLHHNVL